MNKETFIKEKIKNFTIFIKDKIGDDNNIYKNFTNYQTDINAFIRDFIQISKIKIDADSIKKYLDYHGIKKILKTDEIDKIQRYFECFVKAINA